MKGYTTIDAIKNYMLVEIDEDFEPQIEEWIAAIELYIDNETNRDFTPVAETPVSSDRVYDGDGTNTLRIDNATTVTAVKLSPTGDAIATTAYYLYPANQAQKNKIKLYGYLFPKGNQNIVVTGTFGYTAVPADIKLAATVLVAGIINESWGSEGEIASMTIGRYSVSYKTKEQVNDFNKVAEILAYNKKYEF